MKLPALPRLSAPLLTLLASTFLVLAYNLSFWKTFFVATGGARLANLPVWLGAFAALVLFLMQHLPWSISGS